MKFSRVWAMPSKHTFRIKPIAELLQRYVVDPEQWWDPFSGETSPAFFTNDLNPAKPTVMHLDAQVFIEYFPSIDNLLFDPPYSPRQISECYRGIGLEVGMKDTQNASLYARVKNAAAERMTSGGLAICCGWNSSGMGMKRGYELLEVLMVPHGGAHNDTIVTVEQKQ